MTTFNKDTNPASFATGAKTSAPVKNRFDGTVLSVHDNKLMMRNAEGKEYSHILASDAKLTCDGQACTAGDLKVGNKIRVTTQLDNRNIATGIECIKDNAEFEESRS